MLMSERVRYRCKRRRTGRRMERKEDESWAQEDLYSLCHDSFLFLIFFFLEFAAKMINNNNK